MPSLEIFNDIKSYIVTTLISVLNAMLAWWGYYVLMLMAGYFSPIASATNNIILNLDTLFFMIPTGVGSALTSFAGASFGRNNFKEGKLYIIICVILNVGIVIISLIYLDRKSVV